MLNTTQKNPNNFALHVNLPQNVTVVNAGVTGLEHCNAGA